MGSIVSKLGPITGYWILIIIALGLAKLFNWVDVNNTMEMLKFVAIITGIYLLVFAVLAFFRSLKRK
jgi:fumarate reductase subunit D